LSENRRKDFFDSHCILLLFADRLMSLKLH